MMIPPKSSGLMPMLSKISLSGCFVYGLMKPEVDAIVYSVTALPVSMYDRASGMNMSLSAASRAEEPSRFIAYSWNTVLKSII